jgi:hypothetical protein
LRRITLVTLVCALGGTALAGAAAADDQVTGSTIPYVRHDTPDPAADAGIAHCNSNATDYPDLAEDPGTGDADANDGGHRRQGNEPYAVVDPTNPNHIFTGWNDYCLTDLGAGWQGFGFSTDGGATWTSSLVPGYPQDTSAEGMASPLFGTHTDAGDPIGAFDNDGNLFVGGIAFNLVKPSNGDIWVATYGTNPSRSMPVDYLRTLIIDRGTPSTTTAGQQQDKPMLEVDRTGGATDGNVYVCWSRFTGVAGQNKIFFSRSTDHGATFSSPIAISKSNEVHSVQGCDIAIEGDGDVYVTFRTINDSGSKTAAGLGYARSTDGGLSFAPAQPIRSITQYLPFDTRRDCGDGPFLCPSDLVFQRFPLEPRVTADQTGELPGVYVVYNEVDPDTIVPNPSSSYSSAGAGVVGQSKVYVVRSLNNGGSWSDPVAVDDQPAGHAWFPDIDANNGQLAVVWQDNRTDDDYSLFLPPGDVFTTFDGEQRAISSAEGPPEPDGTGGGDDIINTWFATLSSATAFTFDALSDPVSTEGHQGDYEMFGSRQIPFQGDYNWISIAPDGGFAYMGWTDNRDVVEGDDPRELAEDGFDDNFDVRQCRRDLAEPAQGLGSSSIPLARRDEPFTGDNCGNAGGLDQNIYGARVSLP